MSLPVTTDGALRRRKVAFRSGRAPGPRETCRGSGGGGHQFRGRLGQQGLRAAAPSL